VDGGRGELSSSPSERGERGGEGRQGALRAFAVTEWGGPAKGGGRVMKDFPIGQGLQPREGLERTGKREGSLDLRKDLDN